MKDYLAYEPSDAWDGYTTLARQYDGLRLDKDEAMAVASRIAELCRRTWKASFYEADPTQSSFPVQAEGSKEWTDFYELRKKHEEATTDEEREAIAKEIKAVVDLWNSWVEDEAVYICDDEDEIEVCQHELNTICTIKILHVSYTEDTDGTEYTTLDGLTQEEEDEFVLGWRDEGGLTSDAKAVASDPWVCEGLHTPIEGHARSVYEAGGMAWRQCVPEIEKEMGDWVKDLKVSAQELGYPGELRMLDAIEEWFKTQFDMELAYFVVSKNDDGLRAFSEEKQDSFETSISLRIRYGTRYIRGKVTVSA